jgi:hypothetical protein
MKLKFLFLLLILSCAYCQSQTKIRETGLWSQYLYKTPLANRWAIAGDFQYRTYEIGADFQQFIARAAVSYQPANTAIDVHAGYGYFTGQPFGAADNTTTEHRLHQDLWFESKVNSRLELKHRVRIEERFVKGQDFRTRFRYTLFLNVPLHRKTITDHTLYAALWNELFINGQTHTGTRTVEYFDRNWAFAGLGYQWNASFKFQVGYMREITPSTSKGQLVISVFHQL